MHAAWFGLFLLAAAAPAPPVGRLQGEVMDQGGSPLAGVKVVAALPHGPVHTAYSNGAGAFAFAQLPVGRYRVTASAPKCRPLAKAGVQVSASQVTRLMLLLEWAAPPEEVRVVQKAPAVSTTTSNVKETFDLDFVEAMPMQSRDQVFNQMVSSAGGQVSSRIRGGVASQAGVAREPVWDDGKRYAPPVDREGYADLTDNPFLTAGANPLSTFAVDVDTASYANVRRLVNEGRLPPAGAVRLEELINYFTYRYPPPRPDGDVPFAAAIEVADCPWNAGARLVRIGLRGRDVPLERRPPSNLVFLIDVSGSMQDPAKLPLVKESLRLLLGQLGREDRVALVVYAGGSGLVLPSTRIAERARILGAIDGLEAGGSTNGGQGIQLAYRVARQAFLKGGNNRVVLATDGDFNVGVTSESELVRLIEGEARSGVFLTVLGFGTGNYQDSTMEKLADKGNGNYAYIDSLAEAKKALVHQLAGTLYTIAKDVKVQVELNPARVGAYRLLGYENRLLRKEDFNDDRKDGGELGSGHTVTALYEVVPPGEASRRALAGTPEVDRLRYTTAAGAARGDSPELMTVKVRYKAPDGDVSRKLEWPVVDGGGRGGSADLRFAAAVAAFGMLLRQSPHAGTSNLALVQQLARGALDQDPRGLRRAFLELVDRAFRVGALRVAVRWDDPIQP